MNLRALIESYKNGNQDCLLKIIEEFNYSINKYSYIQGKMDEDLYNEQLICLIKCVNKFKFNEEHFRRMYNYNNE